MITTGGRKAVVTSYEPTEGNPDARGDHALSVHGGVILLQLLILLQVQSYPILHAL